MVLDMVVINLMGEAYCIPASVPAGSCNAWALAICTSIGGLWENRMLKVLEALTIYEINGDTLDGNQEQCMLYH